MTFTPNLQTAETRDAHPSVAGVPPAAWAATRFWPHRTHPFTPPTGVAVGPDAAVHVLVNQGRWVIECPDCPSAQVASHTDRRFFCVDCENRAVAGLWRPVLWPDDPATVEQLMAGFVEEKRRNWVPKEAFDARARRRGMDPARLESRRAWPEIG